MVLCQQLKYKPIGTASLSTDLELPKKVGNVSLFPRIIASQHEFDVK